MGHCTNKRLDIKVHQQVVDDVVFIDCETVGLDELRVVPCNNPLMTNVEKQIGLCHRCQNTLTGIKNG
jgi:uncharacterized protein YprB with RNaseH-like and TPR domain